MTTSPLPLLALLASLVHCLPGDQRHPSNTSRHHDYCVLGAGPAGLQMGYFLSRAQRDYIILERNSGPGSFFNIYPRHRKLISINKIYTGRRNPEFNLRHDWNSLLSDRPDLLFQRISRELYPEADAFPRYLSLYERELGLRVLYGVDIARVRAVEHQDIARVTPVEDQDIARVTPVEDQDIARVTPVEDQDIARVTPVEDQDIARVTPVEDQDIARVTPVEDQDIARVRAVEHQDIARVRPVEDQDIARVTPVEDQDIARVTPVEDQDIARVTPVEDQDIARVTPVEDQDIARVTPVEDQDIARVTPVEDQDIARVTPVEEVMGGARRGGAWRGGARSYTLTDQHGLDYSCRVLLVSTGLWDPQKVQFVGSELVEGYESIPVDRDQYQDQAVLILGKGNSAFETAQSILSRASRVHLYSPSPVRLAWQTHYVGDLRAVNNELLDTYQLKSLDGLVEGGLGDIAIVQREEGDERRSPGRRRRRRRRRSRSGGREEEEQEEEEEEEGGRKKQFYLTLAELLEGPDGRNRSEFSPAHLPAYYHDNFSLRQPYDRVIRCLGFRFNFSIFDGSARPPSSEEARGRLPGVTAWYEGRGTPGMFVLGAAAHSRDYRSSAGGFIHGFRYTARAVHRVLEQRYHGNPWPATKLWTNQLQTWLMRRLNEASGPYQMFGTLGDVVLLRGSRCEYLEEFPLQGLAQLPGLSGHQVSSPGLLVLVLQYGFNRSVDSLGPDRAESDWTRAWRSNFLHPVLYYYRSLPTEREMRLRPAGWPLPRPTAMHHMIEDFLTEWEGPISHGQPLRRFLEHCLQTDLRAFYADSCFIFSLTNRKPPPFCRQGYLRKQGLMGNSKLWRGHEAGPLPSEHGSAPSRTDSSFPDFPTRAGASESSPTNFDL